MYALLLSVDLGREIARVDYDGQVVNVACPRAELEKMELGKQYKIKRVFIGSINGCFFTF